MVERGFLTKLWRMTSAADRLALAVLLALIVLASLGKRPSSQLLGTMLVVFAGMLALPILGARSRTWRVVHELSPIGWVPVLFNLCGPTIVALNPARWDAALVESDAYLFGGLVHAWRNLLGRPDWLTDLASVAYGSFYFVPMAVAFTHYLRKDMAEYGRSILAIQLAFYLPFIGYFAMPALGPRVPAAEEAAVLGGSDQRRASSFSSRGRGERLGRVSERPHVGIGHVPDPRVAEPSAVAGAICGVVHFDRVLDRLPLAPLRHRSGGGYRRRRRLGRHRLPSRSAPRARRQSGSREEIAGVSSPRGVLMAASVWATLSGRSAPE